MTFVVRVPIDKEESGADWKVSLYKELIAIFILQRKYVFILENRIKQIKENEKHS